MIFNSTTNGVTSRELRAPVLIRDRDVVFSLMGFPSPVSLLPIMGKHSVHEITGSYYLMWPFILWEFFNRIGQEPTFKMAVFDFFFTTGDTLRLVEGSGLYFLFTSGTTHESKLECEH